MTVPEKPLKTPKPTKPKRAKPEKATESGALFPLFVGVKFDEPLLSRIDAEAKSRKVSRAVLIREVLDKAVP